jgi:uncharacterized protein (TIGR03083 family)
MTATQATGGAATTPRRAALSHDAGMRLAATEYDRFLTELRALSGGDWIRPTDCAGWDVKALVGHVVGSAEMSASLREQMRQLRVAGRSDQPLVHALTALQVAKHAGTAPGPLVDRFAQIGPRAAKGRRRAPRLVRGRKMPGDQTVNGADEPWTLGYLIDVVLTRDTWMHRIDLTRALGRDTRLTADHDGVLVADVVQEWGERHGQACTLELTGPAGGSWTFGTGGPTLSYDAVEFCRGLSGRGEPALGTEVPF